MRFSASFAVCCGLLAYQGAAPTPFASAWVRTAAAAPAVTWTLIDEYPDTAIPGQADAFFAEAVARETAGKVAITPLPGAKSGLRSRDQVQAVKDGRYAMANSFGGALADESPVFLMSSLPFVTASAAEARALYEKSLPIYEKLFAERGQKLLFVTPWPPSGIWSAAAVNGEPALKALKIRTYDKTGTEMFERVSTAASVVSYADLPPKLQSGEVNAVLSSGDGGAGRQLWKYLPHFSEIVYAVPLSFGTVSLADWKALDDKTRAEVEKAGAATTAHQWEAMNGRVETNYARMRENGVTIDTKPPAAVMDALRGAAKDTLADWRTKAGPEASKVLDDFLKSRH